MGDLEDSVQRHPAGNARKETIWDTAWAISKAMQVGREQEQERIIKLLETNNPNNHGLTTRIMNWVVAEGADPTVQECADFAGEIIALIKAENK